MSKFYPFLTPSKKRNINLNHLAYKQEKIALIVIVK